MSPQGFNQEWMDEFLEILKTEPKWLSGIVYGPQVRLPLAKLRSIVPKKYPIRDYPDITHTRQCQFPVPDWDRAYAMTEGRECINPRPIDEAIIARKDLTWTTGMITYSEGCNDDVNKAIWSALAWDPETKPSEILRQYARYFIGPKHETAFADGLFALERNWRGALATNTAVETTLAHFQNLEKSATPATLRNWRFQQALFRAYMDEYVRQRLLTEMNLEKIALLYLSTLSEEGEDIASAINTATGYLEPQLVHQMASVYFQPHIEPAITSRIHEIGEALFQSIGMQLSVEKYKAIGPDRGASLSTLNAPLNNRLWLLHEFEQIKKLPDKAAQLSAINRIVNWTDPGPGGFYDDLGHPGAQPHLLTGLVFFEDPSRMYSVRSDYEEDLVFDSTDETAGMPRRMSWCDHAESLYDTPLKLMYMDLDKTARYKLRVVYGGVNRRKIRCEANGVELHPYLQRPLPYKPLEFDIPATATAQGSLALTFFPEPGLGGNGRNTQVSEVWLIRSQK
jgi:hypothetical protein